jgi:RHS repeat-associated protein
LNEIIVGQLKTKRDYVGEFYYENDTLKFINHEEGRIVVKQLQYGLALDYQYHLKDHLGNTRLTFSTTNESYTYTATMETELAGTEENIFENIPETRVPMALANSTSNLVVPGANKVARIESTDPIGPLAMLEVNKGDTVKLSAYAYYEGDGSTDGLISQTDVLAALFAGYSGATGISEISSQTQAALQGALAFPENLVPKTHTDDDEAPKAYINYMQFDKDMTFVTSGFTQISTAAQGMKEYLETTPLPIDQNGYVMVYLSNESTVLNWVHFDDFAVTHSKTPIVQVDDYYPFGLTFNSFTRNYSEPQRYKYNGKEEQEEWGVLDFEARMYDAALGRFMTVDPLADTDHSIGITPYHYTANNPILFVDPTGMDWYKNESGQVLFDKNITSQDDLKAAGISGSYLHANKYDKSVVDAIGSHIMNSENGYEVFNEYMNNADLGDGYFLEAAKQNYSTGAQGIMGFLSDNFSGVEDGILLSQMTHDWVDQAGFTADRNSLEHQVGMSIMSDAHGESRANLIGIGNEMRGLFINDQQSGNMINAIMGKPANNGGPTAFEWSDLRNNTKGIEMYNMYKAKSQVDTNKDGKMSPTEISNYQLGLKLNKINSLR